MLVGSVERSRFFFFQQKEAYEVVRGLVGSEMCIREKYDNTPIC